MKYLKLFPTELERIPFEDNEYEEPYVGFTQNNTEYSVTIAGSPREGAKVLPNGDGTFTVTLGEGLSFTVSSTNAFVCNDWSGGAFEVQPQGTVTEGQDAIFTTGETVYYGQWNSGWSGWSLYETSDYTGADLGSVARVVISVKSSGELLHFNKTVLAILTLSGSVVKNLGGWYDGNVATLTRDMIAPFQSSVVNISLTGKVKVVGDEAFEYCGFLESVTIPNSVTELGGYIFNECGNLSSVNIPASVVRIGDSFGQNITSLSAITVDVNNPVYDSRNNCNAIIETATSKLIQGCSSAVVPDGITLIGGGAFRFTGISNINIPNSVIKVGSGMVEYAPFSYCPNLTTVVVGSGVTEFATHCFIECKKLSSFTCKAVTPPVFGTSMFYNTSASLAIYVPAQSVAAYKAATGWKSYASKIQAIPE